MTMLRCYDNARYSNHIVIFCWFASFFSYLGRYNYNACIIEIITEYGITRAEAGTVSAFFFFPYMIGQAVHSILAKRINSVAFIGAVFVLAGGINFFMPLTGPLMGMRILWCLNGVVQSALWPLMVNILTTMLPVKKIAGGLVIMHTTGAAGSAGAFIISAACLKWFPWQAVFFVPAIILLVFGIIWFFGMTAISRKTGRHEPLPAGKQQGGPEQVRKPGWGMTLMTGGFLFAFAAAAGNGFLRDGISVWLPTYMYDTFNVESAMAVFLSVVIPVSQVGGAFFAKRIYDVCRFPFLAAMIFYGIALLSILTIILGGQNSIVLTCFCFAVCATMMTSVNTALVSFFPLIFRSSGLTAFASGHINAFVYLGSIAASSGFGLAADISGWNAVLFIMGGVSVISVIFCLAGWKQSVNVLLKSHNANL
jgi:OPA family glycerol-3-phosphate transporter-like MFS transporter